MAMTYTYYGGHKVMLNQRSDQFVVRASPEELARHDLTGAERMSSASSRVTCRQEELEHLMNRARTIAPTHHAYEDAETGHEFLITDRVMVKFRDYASRQQIDELIGRYGLVKVAEFGDGDYLFQLTTHTDLNPIDLIVKLVENESHVVEIAENDVNHRIMKEQFSIPSDPFYLQQWHLHQRLTHPEVDPRASARVEQAWQALDGTGDADVVIGITDDGCKLDHDDFDSAEKFASWGYMRDFRLVKKGDFDADPNDMYELGQNHGTSCAGVAAAELDGIHTVGVAPGCRLLPIKWESSGPFLLISDSKLRTVLNFISDKVDILSNSWGGRPHTRWSLLTINTIKQLASSGGRQGQGIIFLWAAGNQNCPIHHTASIDVPYTRGFQRNPFTGILEWVGVQTSQAFTHDLADQPGVLIVGAIASNAQRTHYSNYGTGLDLAAPSNNVHTYLRLTVDGLDITTATGSDDDLTPLVTDSFGGTSSATPLAAGIAALVISANPELSASDVISLLKRTASKDLDFTPYAKTPPAIFDPTPTWDVSPITPFDDGRFNDIGSSDGTWSPWFGYGCMNAEAAVQEALQAIGPAVAMAEKSEA